MSDFTDPTPAEEQIATSLENLDLEPLYRDRRLKGLNLGPSTLNPGLTRTVEGASTLTVPVQDPGFAMLDSGLFDTRRNGLFSTPLELQLDKLWFRLVKIVPQSSQVQLVFQDREISLLEEATRQQAVARSRTAMAEYAYRLIRSVHDEKARLRAYVPELHERQAIAKAEGSKSASDAAKKRGLPDGMQLKQWDGATHTLTSTERRNAEKVLEACEGAPQKAQLALLEACIVEPPMFENPTKGDGTSVGILQLTDEHLGGSTSTKGGRRDITKVCGLFLNEGFTGNGGAITLARHNPSMTPGAIAQAVQGSADPSRYQAVQASAQKLLSAWNGGGGRTDGSSSSRVVKPYRFKVTGNYWKTLTGYAQPVNWRVFCVNGVVYFISEERLFLARPRFEITPADVTELTFSEWDVRKDLAEVTFTARSTAWALPPGCVGTIAGAGPLNGNWLLHAVEQPDLADETVKVTLTKPLLKEPEPAPETESGSERQAGETTLTVGRNVDARIRRGLEKATEIDKQNWRYVYGGGHGTFNGPYDCAGLVSAELGAMGLLSEPTDTVGLSKWGRPGKGKWLTVWVSETGDPHTSHTFITFTVDGKTAYVEAGGAESNHTGFHKPRSTAGFEPRHWPGL